jgi:hypothetical protein
MKRTFQITITVEETTSEPTSTEDGTQSDLSRFIRLEDLPTQSMRDDVQERLRAVRTRNSPTYMEGRALHPTTADGRASHARYGTGRKRHTCSRCGSKGRRLNPKTGVCGLGQLCSVMDKGISE